MHIESLKLWHWLLIGALIGLAIGTLRSHTTLPLDPRPGLPLADFTDRAATPYSPAHPALRNLTIYPPVDGRNFVTGEYLRSTGFFSAGQYVPFQLNTPVPFRLPRGPRPPDPTYTVRDFLAATNPSLPYTYAWYTSDAAQFLLCTTASTLLIGGLWPLVLRLLIGAGFGRTPPAEPAYDLDRFSHAPDPVTDAPPAPTDLTPEEADQFHAAARALEATLRTPDPIPTHPSTTSDASAPPVPLSNTPYTPAGPLPSHDDPKDYQGEFYPVARPTHASERN